MPGLSYSFEVTARVGAPPTPQTERLVIRLAPEGVPIAGPTDVVRQARIMASLAGTAVPVPAVKCYDSDLRWFGRPFFVVGFLTGDKLALGERTYAAAETHSMVMQAVEALAALHAVPWEPRREAWGEPLSLADEMKRLDNLLDRPTLDPKVVGRGPLLRERLRQSLPPPERVHVGCVHGDFQWSNLFVQRRSPQGSHRLGAVANRRDLDRPGMALPVFRPRELGNARPGTSARTLS